MMAAAMKTMVISKKGIQGNNEQLSDALYEMLKLSDDKSLPPNLAARMPEKIRNMVTVQKSLPAPVDDK
jgi:hypothetical protein